MSGINSINNIFICCSASFSCKLRADSTLYIWSKLILRTTNWKLEYFGSNKFREYLLQANLYKTWIFRLSGGPNRTLIYEQRQRRRNLCAWADRERVARWIIRAARVNVLHNCARLIVSVKRKIGKRYFATRVGIHPDIEMLFRRIRAKRVSKTLLRCRTRYLRLRFHTRRSQRGIIRSFISSAR